MINALYDMETQDPDDLFALAILATHSQVALRGVTVTPGSKAQIGVVKEALRQLGRDVPVGSFNPNHDKSCVAPYWSEFLGNPAEREPDGLGSEVIYHVLSGIPDTTIITGAPLKNLGAFLKAFPNQQIKHWVGQGGFAGDSVVPPECRLPKFAGLETCPTFNFNGDPNSALVMLSSPLVLKRHLVSKNVCHGVVYDQVIHERVRALSSRRGIDFIFRGMNRYLSKHGDGKKFHDPLACCIAIDPTIADFREVELYRSKGNWGSRLCEGTNTFITIKIDMEKFVSVMLDT